LAAAVFVQGMAGFGGDGLAGFGEHDGDGERREWSEREQWKAVGVHGPRFRVDGDRSPVVRVRIG
jgi:hypothetical protein